MKQKNNGTMRNMIAKSLVIVFAMVASQIVLKQAERLAIARSIDSITNNLKKGKLA